MKKLVRNPRLWYFLAIVFGALAAIPILAGCSLPQWLADSNQVLSLVEATLPAVLSIVSLVTGGALDATLAAKITGIITDAQTAIKAIQVMVQEYQQNPSPTLLGQIEAGIKSVTDNLSAFLSATGITNTALQTKIVDIIDLVLEQLTAWSSLIPALNASSTVTVAANTLVKSMTVLQLKVPLTSKQYKQVYNDVITLPTGDAEIDGALAQQKKM